MKMKPEDAFATVIICTIGTCMFAKGYDSVSGAMSLAFGACSVVSFIIGVAVIASRVPAWFRKD